MIKKISSEQYRTEYWLNRLNQSLQKSSVQPIKKNDDLYQQLNQIINGKGKTVQDIVAEMQARSGYSNFLKSQSSKKDIVAEMTEKYPKFIDFIKRYIEKTLGSMSVPAIVDVVKKQAPEGFDPAIFTTPEFTVFIFDLNKKEKEKHSHKTERNYTIEVSDNDNDIDPANTDMYHNLTPTSK